MSTIVESLPTPDLPPHHMKAYKAALKSFVEDEMVPEGVPGTSEVVNTARFAAGVTVDNMADDLDMAISLVDEAMQLSNQADPAGTLKVNPLGDMPYTVSSLASLLVSMRILDELNVHPELTDLIAERDTMWRDANWG